MVALATTGSSFGTAGSTQVVDCQRCRHQRQVHDQQQYVPLGQRLGRIRRSTSSSTCCLATPTRTAWTTRPTRLAKAQANERTTQAGYSPYYDFNGAGLINTVDAAIAGADANIRQSSITAPTAPAASQGVGAMDIVGTSITPLALGVQETGGSTSLIRGTSSSSSPTSGLQTSVGSNVVSTSATLTSTTGTGTSGTGSSTRTSSHHGRHEFAALDEALSEFDLADAWV